MTPESFGMATIPCMSNWHEIVEKISLVSHANGIPTICVHRFVLSTLIACHPLGLRDARERFTVANGVPPMLYSDISRSDANPMCRLRSCSAFTSSVLERIDRKRDGKSFTWDITNSTEHLPTRCISCATKRDLLFAASCAGGNRHITIDNPA